MGEQLTKAATSLVGTTSYEYQTTDEYLSGNVRVKFSKAESLLEELQKHKVQLEGDAEFDITDNENIKAKEYAEILTNTETVKYNITALQKSIPKQLESSDIDVRFGSTWILPHYIGDFITEKLNLSKYAKEGLGIIYDKHTSTTHVDKVLSTEVYGTKRINAIDIMLDTLNLKDVKSMPTS